MEKNLEDCKIINQWVKYYENAESHIHQQWNNLIFPLIKNFDFESVVDLACGAGRNSTKLSTVAKKIYCVDMNEYAIQIAKEKLANINNCEIIYIINTSGVTIPEIMDDEITFIYQFDSGVHFDKEVIQKYLIEFKRILKPGGCGMFHHSNYGNFNNGLDKSNFKRNPHWRSDMTKELFQQFCEEVGLECFQQNIIDWGGVAQLDCLSFFRKK